jgi:spore maturation protein CgeB
LSQAGVSRLGGARYLRYRDGTTRCAQDEMIEIFEQSKVNLNLTEASQGSESQIKGRTFEIPACRGLLLTGAAEGLDEYYVPGREVIVYDDVAELPEIARRLLADRAWRERIADAGYRRTVEEHGYDRRFAALFREMNLPA